MNHYSSTSSLLSLLMLSSHTLIDVTVVTNRPESNALCAYPSASCILTLTFLDLLLLLSLFSSTKTHSCPFMQRSYVWTLDPGVRVSLRLVAMDRALHLSLDTPASPFLTPRFAIPAVTLDGHFLRSGLLSSAIGEGYLFGGWRIPYTNVDAITDWIDDVNRAVTIKYGPFGDDLVLIHLLKDGNDLT